MIMGGGTTATATSEIIDLGAPTPTWQFGPNMSGGRIEMDAVILPNGRVLAMGGSSSDENESTATFTADLFDPSGPTVSSASANTVPRVYHSVALLLPDATVWLAGGNYTRGFYQHQMEIYEPAYLFSGVDSNGNPIPATRPSISSAPVAISYGSAFTVETPNAADISSVVLVRPGASTHAFDMDQRLVGLSFSHDAGALNVTGPPSGNIAPPGYYMLFVLNSAGTPSLATFVQLTQAPPDFSVSATPSSRTIVQGSSTTYSVSVTALNGFNGNVGLSASGLPAGASASFSPTTISSAGSSTLTINTAPTTPAGSYPIIITATSGSLTHTTSITLIVTVPSDFTISASPASRTISRGSRTTYSVTIGAQGPFSGTVTFTLSGLPKKTTSSFTPSSITGPGTSTLKVLANPTATAGTYTLTITGTSGGISHSTTVGLTIQ
jgi:hypothetical protein